MMPKAVVKGICIVLVALMLLSVVAVLLQVFAIGTDGFNVAPVTPVTGDSATDYLVPIGVILAAILVVSVCVVLPKMKKPDSNTK